MLPPERDPKIARVKNAMPYIPKRGRNAPRHGIYILGMEHYAVCERRVQRPLEHLPGLSGFVDPLACGPPWNALGGDPYAQSHRVIKPSEHVLKPPPQIRNERV